MLAFGQHGHHGTDGSGILNLAAIKGQMIRHLLQRPAQQQGTDAVVYPLSRQPSQLPENGFRQAGEAEDPDASGFLRT